MGAVEARWLREAETKTVWARDNLDLRGESDLMERADRIRQELGDLADDIGRRARR